MVESQDGKNSIPPKDLIAVLKEQMVALSTSLASLHTRSEQMQTQTSSRSHTTTSRTIHATSPPSSFEALVVDQEKPLKPKASKLNFSYPKHGFSETTRHKIPSCEQQKSQHEYSWKCYSSKQPTSYWNHQQQKQQYEASKGSSVISRWIDLVAHISDPSRVLGRESRDAGQVSPCEPCPTFKPFLFDGGKVEDLLILSLCKRIIQRSKRQQLPQPPASQLEALIPVEKAEDSKDYGSYVTTNKHITTYLAVIQAGKFASSPPLQNTVFVSRQISDAMVNDNSSNLKTLVLAFNRAKDKTNIDSCSTTSVAVIESLDTTCFSDKPLQMDIPPNTTLSQSATSLQEDFTVLDKPMEYLTNFQAVIITQQKTQVNLPIVSLEADKDLIFSWTKLEVANDFDKGTNQVADVILILLTKMRQVADMISCRVRPAAVSYDGFHAHWTNFQEKVEQGKEGGNQCPGLDDTLLPGTKSLGVNEPGIKDLAFSSSPLLCGERVLKDVNDMVPVISNSQAWINREQFRCHLLSTEEAPYTQSHSQLDLTTRCAGSKEVSDKSHKHRKRKCTKEDILGRKRKQAEGTRQANHCLDSNEDLSSGKKIQVSIKGDINTKEHNSEQCMQKTVCRHERSENLGLKKRDAQFLEASKKQERSKSQADDILSTKSDSENDCILRKHRKHSSSPNSQVFLENSRKLETNSAVCMSLHNDAVEGRSWHTSLIALKSSLREAGVHNDAREGKSCQTSLIALKSSLIEAVVKTTEEVANQAVGEAQGEGGLSCPNKSAEKEAEGTEEVILNNGDTVGKLDLSMGYPVQLNEQSILLVASVSAEVVPETQESEMQNQDGISAEGEEVCLPKRGVGVFEHTAMDPDSNFPTQDRSASQEKIFQELPSCEDMRNMTFIDVNNVTQNLPFLAQKKETSNQKPCAPVNPPSKGLMNNAGNDTEIPGAYNEECHG
ncbi:hypothetical protein L7F22_025703 [Adiantum nelumboides]|nr:hypothetical protein [Adiantum nelumboides]